MEVEQAFHVIDGSDYLHKLVRDDPEMLDLVIGVLMHFDP